DGPTRRQGAVANMIGALAGEPTSMGPGVYGLDATALAATRAMPFQIELTMPAVAPGFVGNVSGGKVAAEWMEPAYVPLARYGVSSGVRMETDAVRVQITSSGDGAILGVFSADFDRGSDNAEAIFRGRIEGRFSAGI